MAVVVEQMVLGLVLVLVVVVVVIHHSDGDESRDYNNETLIMLLIN